MLGVVAQTVQRRLDRGLRLLTERLGDLGPAGYADKARPEPVRRSSRYLNAAIHVA